jgi:DNA-binding MarR family transcriptional regulator
VTGWATLAKGVEVSSQTTITLGQRIDIWRSLMEVHAAVASELGAELTVRHGLSVNEFDALVNIPTAGLRHHELTDRVILSQSALSRLLDRLEARELIERSEAYADGRGVEIRLTTAGRKLKTQAVRTNAAIVERTFTGQLTDRELTVLGAAFERICAAARGSE